MKNIENVNFGKRENKKLRNALIITGSVLLVTALILIYIFLIKPKFSNKVTVKSIKNQLNQKDFIGVYESGRAYLQEHPYNNSVLIYYGYACFYLAISQNDTFLAQEYLDESINNLRLSLYEANPKTIGQIQYMLGRAYYYKNPTSTNYYADLAVKYLNLAKKNNCDAKDIYEYLGYSYASLEMPMESISAFTQALLTRESDSLLYAIAEQYYKSKEYNVAEQYLFRVINNSYDEDIILKSRNLVATIYIDKGDYDKALNEFNSILEKYPKSADAYYGIGVIYEKQGNLVKARAEWRKTLKLQVNHPGALKKISEY